MNPQFGNGDRVELEVGSIHAVARIRSVDGARIHLALEQGAYLPWCDDLIHVRRYGEASTHAYAGKILHCNASAATVEILAAPAPANGGLRDTIPDLG